MADLNENDNGETLETVQASAGDPQRPLAAPAHAALADVAELSGEDFDARQAAMGGTRRSGPALPEGEELEALGLAAAADAVDEPTEVEEPRPKDR